MLIDVFKFGGASVKSAGAIKNVANILASYKGAHLVIVISAMGKNTNALEGVVKSYFDKTEPGVKLKAIKEHHFAIAEELCPGDQSLIDSLNETFVEIEWILEEEPENNFDYIYDQIVAMGEMLSTKIVCKYLQSLSYSTTWLDVRDVLVTDSTYREGRVQWKETVERIHKRIEKEIKTYDWVITQGFVGSNTDNETVTLGREGSDYTASIFSFAVDARSMSIWKDVPGILTADPRLFDNVSKIDRLSYSEAIEMTYYGAKVIHPKTIKPIQNKGIPMYVKSFVNPKGSGTLISNELELSYPPVVVIEPNQVLMHISTKDFSFVAEHHLSELFSLFKDHRIKVNMMRNTAISFSVCTNAETDRIDQLRNALSEKYNVVVDEGLELITIRHFNDETVEELARGKVILFQEQLRNTIQMVAKNIPVMKRKHPSS